MLIDRETSDAHLSPIPRDSLAGAVVLFSRVLKKNGLAISIPAVMDALQSVTHVGIEDRNDFKTTLRTVFTTRVDEWALFERLFAEFWIEDVSDKSDDDGDLEAETDPNQQTPEVEVCPAEAVDSDFREREAWNAKPYVIYSPAEILKQQDFKDVPEDFDPRMAQLIREILAPLLRRASRRSRPVRASTALDFRRMFRRNLKYGGELYELPGIAPRQKIRRIVFLCDVSGSMNPYQRFILGFIKELQNLPTKVESFVFATELHRITPSLKRLPFGRALHEISESVRDWSGGTRIGQCLHKFNREWGSLLGASTVLLIHSDGWDRGDTNILEQEISRIHRRAYRVIWINPLLGSASYEPTCRGMRVALPHIDYFLSGHNLLSLERISGTLRGFF